MIPYHYPWHRFFYPTHSLMIDFYITWAYIRRGVPVCLGGGADTDLNSSSDDEDRVPVL